MTPTVNPAERSPFRKEVLYVLNQSKKGRNLLICVCGIYFSANVGSNCGIFGNVSYKGIPSLLCYSNGLWYPFAAPPTPWFVSPQTETYLLLTRIMQVLTLINAGQALREALMECVNQIQLLLSGLASTTNSSHSQEVFPKQPCHPSLQWVFQ